MQPGHFSLSLKCKYQARKVSSHVYVHGRSLGSNITEAGVSLSLPPPETTVILSKENTFLFKTSSHGLIESNLYCIVSITTKHVEFKTKWIAFEQTTWNDVS